MADFRKWLLAFAVLVLVSSFAVPVSAQQNPPLQCVANAGATPTVRAEGLTERVGDLVFNCTGGTPTAAGANVPAGNITIFFSTNYTGRITATSGSFVEALLLIDEPHSAANPGIPLMPCDPTNVSLGICTVTGTGTGVGTYDGTATRPNVYQARLVAPNAITFFGVPIDPPGTLTNRSIRITNLVANANQLGVSATLIPTQVTVNISISPFNLLPLNNPQQTLAFVQRGLVGSLQGAPDTFTQCNSELASISATSFTAGTNQHAIRFTEGFPASFKERNIAVHQANVANPGSGASSYPTDSAQDVPGANYFSETGFLVNGVPVAGVTPSGFGPFLSPNSAANFTSTARGLNVAGKADQGTRLMATFNSIPNGVNLWVPTRVALVNQASTSTQTGFLQLVTTDANGAGGTPSTTTGTLSQVTLFNGSGIAVYEVIYDDPFNIEQADVPVYVSFTANPGNNLPAPGVQATVTGSFAPLSNVGTASSTAPMPRFAPSTTPLNSFIVVKCSCNILFPFVTNQLGYDTGIAIANTSADPYGTTPQTGTVTLNYYSGGTPPPAQTTNANVPAGQQLLFTLSGGGNFGIAPTPGFQGYIIAQAQFQYCHAFAYVSAQGALPTAPGASEAYLGLILDSGGLPNRPKQIGEVLAH